MLALSEVLDLSLREQSRLLEAAGSACVFRETPLSADERAHMRGMLQFILDRHLPYAAAVVDRDVVPCRPRLRVLLAPEFRGVCGEDVMSIRRAYG
jgi:hypothetical protein